jgi:hypothetical protein
MRALIIEKFISTRSYSKGAEKVTPIFPFLTQQTLPETWPRLPSSSLIVWPMYGIKEKMIIAPEAERFASSTECFRPRRCSTAVRAPASNRGSQRWSA